MVRVSLGAQPRPAHTDLGDLMSAVPTTAASVLECHHTEWRLLIEQPCNVLVEGSVPATDAFVRLLLPHIREPIVEHRPPTTLNLPTGETGALIVTDAAALSRDEQRRLLAWIGEAGSRAQIITTASCRLFALVEAGVFDAALYYRLNVLLLRATDTFQSGLLFGSA
jgi:hypothetical protein